MKPEDGERTMKCALCKNLRLKSCKLCSDCNEERLHAASCERTMLGTGLTYSNSEKYSDDNWIKAVKAARRNDERRT